jgi:hypothetical protein
MQKPGLMPGFSYEDYFTIARDAIAPKNSASLDEIEAAVPDDLTVHA